MRIPRPPLVLLACLPAALFAALTPAAPAQTDVAVQLDGSRIEQRVVEIKDGRVHFEDEGQQPVDLLGLRRIERPIDKLEAEASMRVYLRGGGMIRATAVTLDSRECVIDWPLGDTLKLPIEAIRAVRLSDETAADKLPGNHELFDRALAEGDAQKDRLFGLIEGKVQPVDGVFGGMTAEGVKFTYGDRETELPRDRVFAVTLARLGKEPEVAGLTMLHLSDGSSFWAKVNSMSSGLAKVDMLRGPTIDLPWATVQRLDVRSDRVVFLASLDPTRVRENAIAYVGPWQRNRSVRGKPLTIRGKRFDSGFGVHATSRLTFNTHEKFPIFAATIGIDDETNGRGDCEFVIYGDDDQELLRKRVRGNDEPLAIRVNIAGHDTITLAVERGEDLDFSDHGDWCDPRFIRE